MDITDIQSCTDFFQENYLKTFYLVITYNGKSFILIGEKGNFPHLMGIEKNTYRLNGYNNPKVLFNDIIKRNAINANIIPNSISTTSKTYKKALNFKCSKDIFWKNSGPLTVNYNPALSSTKLNNVDVLQICERNGSNLLLDSRNSRFYTELAASENIHCKINGIQY